MLAPLSWCDQASFDLRCWCEGRCGQESEGGIVRAAAPRVRVWHWHGEGCGADVRGSSPDGAPGGGERTPPLRGYCPRAKPALGPVVAFIDAILAADATAPRKQR